jgi:ureidoglycolate lyase
MARVLVPQPLTAQAFAPFGDVVEAGSSAKTINRGTTQYFSDLARVDVTPESGRPRVSVYRVTPYRLPMSLAMLERHPLGSQLFMPLRGEKFLVVVAPRGDRIEPSSVRAFVANGAQGVNYHPGTWHHPVIALNENSEFLVIDREGPGANCDEHPFAAGTLVLEPPAH